MIKELTQKQKDGIVEYQKLGLEIGRSTTEINKGKVENALTKIYEIINLKKPQIVYCSSPLMAQVFINLMSNNTNNEENILANIRENIGANIRDNIWENIGANIRDNIWANIRANIGANIRANIGENNLANIRENNLEYHYINIWGQYDIHWIMYYKYYNDFGLIKDDGN